MTDPRKPTDPPLFPSLIATVAMGFASDPKTGGWAASQDQAMGFALLAGVVVWVACLWAVNRRES